MAYNKSLAIRVRSYLMEVSDLYVEEKKMFGGLAFLINDKMCINVSDNQLMCRFDPKLAEHLSERPGFIPMIMNGKKLKGYSYVDPIGYKSDKDFEFWLKLCLEFNALAKSSKKR